jgi:glycosyltransferase involved in cell wall biosynthesis
VAEAENADREETPFVSLVVVTHNAFRYLRRLLRSLPRTRGVEYELIVVDNRSRTLVRAYLALAALRGRIQRLCLLERNTLFAPANNIGVAATSRSARHVLLLNSDTEVRRSDWLLRLLELHRRGATSYGFVKSGPVPRADGYCMLVDRDLYLSHGLDEDFEWFWSVTKLQAELLNAGHSVRAVREHDHVLYHFGGKSGGKAATRNAKGMKVPRQDVLAWFAGKSVDVIERA